MSDYLTAEDAAELLHLNVKRVQTLARAGRLPAVRVGRKWLFPRAELLRAMRPAARLAEPARDREGPPAPVDLSARNQLAGTITGIEVEGMMAEVRIRVVEQEVVAVITRGSVERLGLRVGGDALAVIKSTEVMVARTASSS